MKRSKYFLIALIAVIIAGIVIGAISIKNHNASDPKETPTPIIVFVDTDGDLHTVPETDNWTSRFYPSESNQDLLLDDNSDSKNE